MVDRGGVYGTIGMLRLSFAWCCEVPNSLPPRNPLGFPYPCCHCYYDDPSPQCFSIGPALPSVGGEKTLHPCSFSLPHFPPCLFPQPSSMVTGFGVISNCLSLLLYLCLWYVKLCLSSGVINRLSQVYELCYDCNTPKEIL